MAEQCVVEVLVTFFESGDSCFQENYSIWLFPLKETTIPYAGEEEKIESPNPEATLKIISDGDIKFIEQNVGFDFSFVGEGTDLYFHNGIQFVARTSNEDVFRPYVTEFMKMAGHIASRSIKDENKPATYRFLTLWTFEDDEIAHNFELIGLINPKLLQQSLDHVTPTID